MVEEKNNGQGYRGGNVYLAQTTVDIPGFKPDIRGFDGKINIKGNLGELSGEIQGILFQRSFYRKLLQSVRQDRRSAIFYGVIGGISIVAATAVGFEFGIRHGQDLRILPKLLKRKI